MLQSLAGLRFTVPNKNYEIFQDMDVVVKVNEQYLSVRVEPVDSIKEFISGKEEKVQATFYTLTDKPAYEALLSDIPVDGKVVMCEGKKIVGILTFGEFKYVA